MNLQNLFSQFIDSSSNAPDATDKPVQGMTDKLAGISSSLPGGLAGGAAAGGIMALLIGNKSARKFAGKAATYGGAALLGGLAYRAYQNWQRGVSINSASTNVSPGEVPGGTGTAESTIAPPEQQQPVAELTLLKAMIGAAKSDGHIDVEEQARIFGTVDQMNLSAESKAMVFDLLRREISVQELAAEAYNLEQKSEIYLASCMVINLDHPSERNYLEQLASALSLPSGLSNQLESQALKAVTEAA